LLILIVTDAELIVTDAELIVTDAELIVTDADSDENSVDCRNFQNMVPLSLYLDMYHFICEHTLVLLSQILTTEKFQQQKFWSNFHWYR